MTILVIITTVESLPSFSPAAGKGWDMAQSNQLGCDSQDGWPPEKMAVNCQKSKRISPPYWFIDALPNLTYPHLENGSSNSWRQNSQIRTSEDHFKSQPVSLCSPQNSSSWYILTVNHPFWEQPFWLMTHAHVWPKKWKSCDWRLRRLFPWMSTIALWWLCSCGRRLDLCFEKVLRNSSFWQSLEAQENYMCVLYIYIRYIYTIHHVNIMHVCIYTCHLYHIFIIMSRHRERERGGKASPAKSHSFFVHGTELPNSIPGTGCNAGPVKIQKLQRSSTA